MTKDTAASTRRTVLCLLALLPAFGHTQPSGAGPAGNPFISPAEGEAVSNSQSVILRWTPTTSGTVDLVLNKGSPPQLTPLYPLVEKLANNGSFAWRPCQNLPTGLAKYTVKLIAERAGQYDTYQYSNTFQLYGPATLERQTFSPANGGTPAMPAAPAPFCPPLEDTTGGSASMAGPPTQQQD